MDWAKLFRRSKPAPYEPYAEQPIYPIGEMMRHMAQIAPEDYGWYAFSRELLRDKFADDEKRALMERAHRCGTEEAELLRAACGVTGGVLTPARAADFLGVEIAYEDAPSDGGQVLFATFTEPDRVTVYRDAVRRGEELLKDAAVREALPQLDSTRVLLWHELFHVVELQKKATIFTKTEKIALWRGPIPNRSGILCLGEIAAMQFAAAMEGLTYSPYCLDVLLVYGYDAHAASALFDEIKQVLSSRAEGTTKEDAPC
ncbi:hypothetical protein [Selenomonas sp. TAMA-11512]|uniref:hypothetical protein n=1 Tax=Selenomonas sp. TAMA-11512 TaxID=3095337 RepID=UPI0030CD7315